MPHSDSCPVSGHPCQFGKPVQVTELLGGEFLGQYSVCELCCEGNLPGVAEAHLHAIAVRLFKLGCPRCGWRAEDITQHGRLGCAACYDHFRADLMAVFWQVHKAERHVGKRPKASPGPPSGGPAGPADAPA